MNMNCKSVGNVGVIGILLLGTACAPSSLYKNSVRGNWTVGEIPRDGRGEPVWAAIPPVPGIARVNQPVAVLAAWPVAETQEGDAGDRPMPPRE